MALVYIADRHICELIRLSEAYEMTLEKLVDQIIAIGIESLDNWEDYEVVEEEP
jgi:hypothetical protein